MKTEIINRFNTTALAYMGDAVYEQAVREHILMCEPGNVRKMYYMATGLVNASAQAMIIKKLFDELSEDEQILVKRARNRKYTTKAKNSDPVTYKWATAFEALIGYLYLSGDENRLKYILSRAIGIIGK